MYEIKTDKIKRGAINADKMKRGVISMANNISGVNYSNSQKSMECSNADIKDHPHIWFSRTQREEDPRT